MMPPSPQALPVPDTDAQAHSDALKNLIADEITTAGGAITFACFMDLALYAPGLGYYVAGSCKFGDEGDFVTAPEISPLFSRCLARQVRQVLATLERGDVLEVGAGSGVMARDILLELAALDCLPEHYYILDLSPDLRQRQRETIEQGAPQLLDRVVWLDALPDAGFQGVVLANELLDAMPAHIVTDTEVGFQERYVACTEAGFSWQNGPLSQIGLEQRLARLTAELGDDVFCSGYATEINLAADAWLTSIAAMLAKGVVFVIDYGFPQHEFYHPERDGGTLMCHYRHRAHIDPLVRVGLQDITAHVDFTAVAHAAVDSGLSVMGYTGQAQFLLSMGLTELAPLEPEGDLRRHLSLTQQIKKLTLPNEMGELFKVIALGKGIAEPLQGFMFQDRRGRL